MFFSVNDVIVAGELALKLFEWGSSKYTSAHIEYRDFMRDISNVSTALQAIQKEVDSFQNRHAALGLDFSTLSVAVGGVYPILQRCERLLRENSEFRWAEGFIVNVKWNFDLAERVKALQTRVLFHCTKINLVIQPLQLHINRKLREIMILSMEEQEEHFEKISQQLEAIHIYLAIPAPVDKLVATVPPELVNRFAEAASSHSANGMNIVQDYIDAVVYWYEESTRAFVPEPPTMMRPPTLQYLNLMKCLWLLQRMQKSQYFGKFCHDTLSKAYVRQLQRKVDHEFRRFQGEESLQAPEIDDLLLESPDCFEIWPDLGIIDGTAAIMEAQSFELLLFKAPLQRLVRNRDRELTVFRVGEDSLRLVVSITSPNVAVADRFNHNLDCRRAVLVPIYAHPENNSSCSVSWKSSMDNPLMEELPFKTKAQLLEFQESITNFMVRFHGSSLQAIRGKGSAFKMDGRHGTELGTVGRIQLWSYRKPRIIERITRQQSTISAGTSGTGSSSTHGWTQEILGKVNAGVHVRSVQSGAYLDPPIPAKLVVFTLSQGNLRLVNVTIDEKTIIDTNLCDCSDKKKAAECNRICIRQSSKDAIKAQVYDAGTEDLSRFNVALLRHPPHVDAARNAEVQAFKFLTLDFSNVAEKKKLCDTFETLTRLVRHNAATYNKDLISLRGKHVYEEG